MTTPIIFPDVEMVLCAYLRTALAARGYTIATVDPAPVNSVYVGNTRGTSKRAVWVRRDGGPALDVVREEPRVGTNVFDTTEQKAGDLARTVAALIMAAADGNPIVKVTQAAGPSGVADPSGPRRFMSHEVRVRGAALA